MNETRPHRRIEATRRVYVAASIILLNFVLLFAAVNFGILAWTSAAARAEQFSWKSPGPPFNPDGSPAAHHGLPAGSFASFDYFAMPEVPPAMAFETLVELYQSSGSGPVYHPWVGFTEREFAGKHVHITSDPVGYSIRRTTGFSANRPGKPFTVFAFGGSTTFGFPVSDEQTWPSYLAAALSAKASGNISVRVVNHGHCAYFSSQEVALALRLLKLGERPDVMIFMDGINEDARNWGENEHDDVPEHSEVLDTAYELYQDRSPSGDWRRLKLLLGNLPLFRLFPRMLEGHRMGPLPTPPDKQDVVAIGDRMFERYHANQIIMASAAKAFGVETLFFLQPDALQNYPVELYPRRPAHEYFLERKKHVRFFSRARKDSSLHSLEDLFAAWGEHRKALVDGVHYSPAFNQFLAEKVAKFISLDGSGRQRVMN